MSREMDLGRHDLIMKDEVYRVVGAAMAVSRELGAGFLEAVYQDALEIELTDQAIPFVAHPTIRVSYKGRVLSRRYVPDFVCYDQVVVEVKALRGLSSVEQAQLLNYLKATGHSVGLLLNFGTARLEWKRMVSSPPAATDSERPFAGQLPMTQERIHE